MNHEVYRTIGTPRPGGIVAVCDHASNRVPDGIDLGIAPDLLKKHIAWDIGTAGVMERLAQVYGIAGFLAEVGRLAIDLHREEDSPGLIPETSDGHSIPGNRNADRQDRIARFHRPYHDAMEAWLADAQPKLILAIHSFTPELESDPHDRPWEIALLYNQDDRAARHAIRGFTERGLIVGDNQPYSGRQLNATMNRHAEAHGRPYCAIEIRNDLITDTNGQALWAAHIAEVANGVALALE
ncbi:N-formylglutamate amidohydrolase [Altericroceibacterium xinjiangense]|uniref:N-formylglutamate amidohydrolase n=1 Tax=Altericroceibacterium xinjiangense TaxID=762261 RepID=UPI000F7E0483|nr:N-formylglutamate amidohydrolase [Altericroceibacterium xinjiangense]